MNQSFDQKNVDSIRLSVDSTIDHFWALKRAMLRPTVILELDKESSPAKDNVISKLSDEVKDSFVDFHNAFNRVMSWKSCIVQWPIPDNVKVPFYLAHSQALQSFISLYEPLLQLLNIVDLSSHNWMEKISALETVESQYMAQKSALDVAIRKMEHMKAEHEMFRRLIIIRNWERLVRRRIMPTIKMKDSNPPKKQGVQIVKFPGAALKNVKKSLNVAFQHLFHSHHKSYNSLTFKVTKSVSRFYPSVCRFKSFTYSQTNNRKLKRSKSVLIKSAADHMGEFHYRSNSASLVYDLRESNAQLKNNIVKGIDEPVDPPPSIEAKPAEKTFSIDEIMEMSVMHLSQIQELTQRHNKQMESIKEQYEREVKTLTEKILRRPVIHKSTKDASIGTDELQPIQQLKKTVLLRSETVKLPPLPPIVSKTPQFAPKLRLREKFEENDKDTRDFFIRLAEYLRRKEQSHNEQVKYLHDQEEKITMARIDSFLPHISFLEDIKLEAHRSLVEEFNEILDERLPLTQGWTMRMPPKKQNKSVSSIKSQSESICKPIETTVTHTKHGLHVINIYDKIRDLIKDKEDNYE